MIHMSDTIRWAIPKSEVELCAQEQINNITKIPSFLQMAVMPDVHTGYDLPIGCVVLLDNQISPSFVGFDIGCGMCHINIGKEIPDIETKKKRYRLFKDILDIIPVGTGTNQKEQRYYPAFTSASGDTKLTEQVNNDITKQLGTLGSGNHFIEIGINSKEEYGITIHSGSRHVGYAIASYYMNKGRLFDINSDLGRAYIEDMKYADQYALANRLSMIKDIYYLIYNTRIDTHINLHDDLINETHNHAIVNSDGTVLHRKGATPAKLGQKGVIPINQRDGTYITVGLGNEEFLCSASHGAGRKMSRKQAQEKITTSLLTRQMKGIICKVNKSLCDEGPDAYKNGKYVIEKQDGILVNIIDHFKPIIVIKG